MRIMIEMSGNHWSQQRKMAAVLGLSTAKDINDKNVHEYAVLETDDLARLLEVLYQIEYPIKISKATGFFCKYNRVDWLVSDKTDEMSVFDLCEF